MAEESVTGIYYFDVNVIGRSSGRSAVGAAAYRAGEKLQSVAHASYQSGEKLYDIGDNVTHDYTRKGGVAHSEIMLPKTEILLAAERNLRPNAEIQNQPQGAPPEYADRQTLWNAVEKREKRKDAQLAREFIVALPREFNLDEQIDVMREYIQESFVNKGMIADFSIHDKGDGNPHSHIMLTMRDVTPDGFGLKNTAWNKKDVFLEWRKGWADVNNRMFERKGLDERIDHRSYRDRGIDREPMVHMGYMAAALERKGIRTERGDMNREIKRRNLNLPAKTENLVCREAVTTPECGVTKLTKGAASGVRNQTSEFAQHHAANDEREARKAPQIKEPHDETGTVAFDKSPPEPQYDSEKITFDKKLSILKKDRGEGQSAKRTAERMGAIEEHLKAEKAAQIVEKMQAKREAEKIARQMHELTESCVALEKELIELKDSLNDEHQQIPPLSFRAEQIDEHAKNIAVLQSRTAQLQAERQNLPFWNRKRKQDLDRVIERAEQDIKVAQHYFKEKYHIMPDEAPAEIKRIREKIQAKKDSIRAKEARISEIVNKKAAILLEYHTQKLLNDTRPDKQQIEELLEKMRDPPQSDYDKWQYDRIDRRLNVITEEDFQRVIEKLPDHQAQALIEQRKRAQEKELAEIRKHTQTHDLSRGR
ncbi:MobA/MobL family protein [Candidatus Bathycorpusculum sp.]|uniref:MobA/MobL family protein n=1 Tax=Candidatus Bathycorpusculum sp. TaxID=2994959 RepID=UPI00281A18AA|nr:MobA/MobL family protein [Candidatus Termitimicrobium sp.]MCL2431769.1 MobA/MobL family protein [Candidatus Termitimicrobium sp.]